MADIGSTLRETRIREKIDITVVENSTKIRAKYLRALENEEWSVMPGPTYVKSFLRTYAEFLGLDAHMLVEEYRGRYEQPEELELPAFGQDHTLRERVRPPGPPSRSTLIAAIAVGVLALLFVLGITAGDDKGGNGGKSGGERAGKSARQTGRATRDTGGAALPQGAGSAHAAPARQVALSVVASRPVWVCLVDAHGKALVGGRTLAAGDREGPFRSSVFRVTLGNGGGDLRVNGKLRDTPDSSVPVGLAVSAKGNRPLPEQRRPTCAGGGQGAGSP